MENDKVVFIETELLYYINSGIKEPERIRDIARKLRLRKRDIENNKNKSLSKSLRLGHVLSKLVGKPLREEKNYTPISFLSFGTIVKGYHSNTLITLLDEGDEDNLRNLTERYKADGKKIFVAIHKHGEFIKTHFKEPSTLKNIDRLVSYSHGWGFPLWNNFSRFLEGYVFGDIRSIQTHYKNIVEVIEKDKTGISPRITQY